MKTTKCALAVALGAIALVAPRQAQANALTLSPSGFGVGVGVAELAGAGGTVNAITGQNFQNGVSTFTASTPTGTALGNANLGSPTPNSPLTMGLKLSDTGTTPHGEVVAADGFTVLGGSATANFTITGTFSPGDPVDSEFGFSVRTYLDPTVIAGSINFAGHVSFVGGVPNFGWEYSVNRGAFLPWTNGSPVTVSVPITSADMGFIADMTGLDTGTGVPPSPYVIDFSDPLTISFTPGPGGEVDLATGQKFFGPAAASPEPSSLILLGTGLLGLAGMTWRKKLLA